MAEHTAHIAYGKGRIPLNLDPRLAEWHVITPKEVHALPDQHAAFLRACRKPTGSRPLRDVVQSRDRVVIVTSDGTRPVPNRALIPWLLEELPVPDEQVTVLIGSGSHRANTPDEITEMFGEDSVRRVRIVNHDAYDPGRNVPVGQTESGEPAILDAEYVNADKRIVIGFIEPHFFAGYSGGAKGVAPGVASIDTICHLHSYDLIAHPQSTWGVLDGNPVQQTIQEMVALCPPDFLVNVTLNNDKAITGVFAGDYREAHRAGCAHVRTQAMAPVAHEFPVVITSNSGYPLDQNLYQSVKGMSAAARIVHPGGVIIMASECSDGIPSHGNFGTILHDAESLEDVDRRLRGLSAPLLDQWQAQVLVQIRLRCDVALYSTLDPVCVRDCKLEPVPDLERAVHARVEALGAGAPVAVLPEGPLTIPYVADTAS